MVDRAILEEAVSDGIADADAEMREANPVLEDLIEGLEIIKLGRGPSGKFDYGVQPLLDGPTLLETTLPEKDSNMRITIAVNDDGAIGYWGLCGMRIVSRAPREADIVAMLAQISKQARMARQIIPVPPPPEPPLPPPAPSLPAEDVSDAVKEMRTQMNRNAARNNTGQRSPGQ